MAISLVTAAFTGGFTEQAIRVTVSVRRDSAVACSKAHVHCHAQVLVHALRNISGGSRGRAFARAPRLCQFFNSVQQGLEMVRSPWSSRLVTDRLCSPTRMHACGMHLCLRFWLRLSMYGCNYSRLSPAQCYRYQRVNVLCSSTASMHAVDTDPVSLEYVM